MTVPPAPRQTGPGVWRGEDLADPGDWTWTLTADELDELRYAIHAVGRSGFDDGQPFTAGEIELPTLGPKLTSVRATLTHGRGFQLIRGIPIDESDYDFATAAFLALGAHIGRARSQNAAGDLLGHVRDVGLDADDPGVRIYQTSARQTFHTDSADVVGLLCLRAAEEGGDSLLVSAATIYNEMLDRDPRLAAALFHRVATDRRGEVPAGESPYFVIPVLSWYDGSLTVMYQRQYIESAQRFDDAPRLTAELIAALDLFDAIADDPDIHLRMRLEPGDVQFVHNHSLLHDRTAFRDQPEARRHLLRLWLTVDGDRRLPDVFASRFGSTTVGDRGGIVVPD